MALVPSIITLALKDAFVAGETAMEVEAKKNINLSKQVVSNADIKRAGGIAFAAIAGPAIDAYIRSATVATIVTTAVVTAGSSVAQAGTGTGAGVGAPGVGLS